METVILVKKKGQWHRKHHLCVPEEESGHKCRRREIVVSASLLMALLNKLN